MSWKKLEGQGSGADVWKFESQAIMEGKFIRKEENIGPNKSNMYYFSQDNGEVAVWGNTVLDSRLAEIVVGDKVKIVFLGEVKGKGPRPYKNFDVFVWVNTQEEAPF